MQEHILILGAGRSSGSLINYLGKWSEENGYGITVADIDEKAADFKTRNFPHAVSVKINPADSNQLEKLVACATLVISLLPPSLHPQIAKYCLKHYKDLATASYASDEIKSFDAEAKEKGLCFLFELGVDPGIDHMSSLKMIEEARKIGGKVIGFKSFSGALLSPETEKDNPWNYKFTWNPRNVVIAGQGIMAQFRIHNKEYFLPYLRLFKELWKIDFPKLGEYEAYPNRNSLEYVEQYQLQEIPFLVRGTLRRKGFSEAWNALIQLGATNDNTRINIGKGKTTCDFFNKLVREPDTLKVKEKFEKLICLSLSEDAWKKIQFLELDNKEPLEEGSYTPAEVLEKVLLSKWKLNPQDMDMVLMYHELEYELEGKKFKSISRLSMKGKNADETAISSTVGLPLAMGVKLLLNNKIKQTGIVLPIYPEIYLPILEELESYGIKFEEEILKED